jgi:light-regulated signal transduction histidine kinase (bacteriophytochrome)
MLENSRAGLEYSNERLRSPGLIQSFGSLLTLHPITLRVLNASENVATEIGILHKNLLGVSLIDLVENAEAIAEIQNSLKSEEQNFNNPILVLINGERFDLVLHHHDGLLLAEFERLVLGAPTRVDLDQLSDKAIMGMLVPSTLDELLDAAPKVIRLATGFDRVLLYKFDDTYRGQVVGEARRVGVESFLGMFFPESDIGAPARELYSQNFARYIPSVGAQPAKIEPRDNPLTNKPIDLSHAVLRAVANCHIEYLSNMGVSASMSFSIVSEGRLWGLFACHHYTPSQLSFTQRLICEQVAMMFVAKLTEFVNPAALEEEMLQRRIKVFASSPLTNSNPLSQHWTKEQERELLDLVNADGAALYMNGKVGEIGECPDLTYLHDFIVKTPKDFENLMRRYDNEGLFYSRSTVSSLPFGNKMREKGSGLMFIPLSADRPEFLFWFRPELVLKATWAGNPSDSQRKELNTYPSPRRSFAAWKEDIRDLSAPWTSCEIANATALRDHVIALGN